MRDDYSQALGAFERAMTRYAELNQAILSESRRIVESTHDGQGRLTIRDLAHIEGLRMAREASRAEADHAEAALMDLLGREFGIRPPS